MSHQSIWHVDYFPFVETFSSNDSSYHISQSLFFLFGMSSISMNFSLSPYQKCQKRLRMKTRISAFLCLMIFIDSHSLRMLLPCTLLHKQKKIFLTLYQSFAKSSQFYSLHSSQVHSFLLIHCFQFVPSSYCEIILTRFLAVSLASFNSFSLQPEKLFKIFYVIF